MYNLVFKYYNIIKMKKITKNINSISSCSKSLNTHLLIFLISLIVFFKSVKITSLKTNNIAKRNTKSLLSYLKSNFTRTNINDICILNPKELHLSPQTKENNQLCDLLLEYSICIFNEKKIVQSNSKPISLVAYYTFDDIRIIDYSGNNHNSRNMVIPGIGIGGFGFSAMFNNGDYVKIPNSFMLNNLQSYSISFFIFLVEDFYSQSKGNRFCPIFQKGKDDIISKNYARAPSIILDRKTNHLKVYIKTNDMQNNEGEYFISKSKLSLQKWSHIGLIKNNSKLTLVINSIIDTEYVLKGGPVIDYGDIYIGGVKWLKNFCEFPLLIDEVKIYNTAISIDIIKAEGSLLLSGIASDMFQYGCSDCDLNTAETTCKGNYKLCTTIELHNGGYQIARTFGWLDESSHIWTNSAIKKKEDFKDKTGLALCCKELPVFE